LNPTAKAQQIRETDRTRPRLQASANARNANPIGENEMSFMKTSAAILAPMAGVVGLVMSASVASADNFNLRIAAGHPAAPPAGMEPELR